MRRFFVRFNRLESFVHTQSSAGFTINTSGFEFSVHTGACASAQIDLEIIDPSPASGGPNVSLFATGRTRVRHGGFGRRLLETWFDQHYVAVCLAKPPDY